ncbi:MAG TPA: hypothetical protein DCW88_10440 [Agrobacterium sp.]|uniref:hypothetical protein n=1 Tax=Agrobacterium pusense TaxID=648995 RepID=UPI000E9BB78C|nr:hypothetical protein [Agrobacterium sp.]
MSHLSDTITKHVQESLNKDGFHPRLIAPRIWEELDAEEQKKCGLAEIVRRMKTTARTLTNNAFAVVRSGQIELPFKIDGAVAMDIEGNTIRLTESLSQLEFRRAIEIRRKQIKDDVKQLKEWESAERMASPYWRDHSEWTFGQCVRQFARDQRGQPRRRKAAPKQIGA